MSASVRRPLSILTTFVVCAFIAEPASAAMLWFDETQGSGRSVADFAELADAYADFTSVADTVFSFNGLGAGTVLSNQYAAQGVTFTNAGSGAYASSGGMRPEGGNVAENITGYDGTYMPGGDDVFVKFNNNNSAAPFSIHFDTPVGMVGGFVGMGVQGSVHTLTVSVYDDADQLLSQRTVQSWLWESNPNTQNYESFFAVSDSDARIRRVEILNDATVNFANALIFDNLAFSSSPVPEPATWLMLIGGASLAWMRGGKRRSSAIT